MLTLEEISARLEIQDALVRYCRGLDRRDARLIESAYFPDAIDTRSYNAPDASPAEFAKRAVDGFGDTPQFSQHHITNVSIDLDLDAGVALVESYHLVMHPVGPHTSLTLRPEDGEEHLRVIGGRFLDRFERRDGQWRIARRWTVTDWSRADLPGGPTYSDFKPHLVSGPAGRDPVDAVLRAGTAQRTSTAGAPS